MHSPYLKKVVLTVITSLLLFPLMSLADSAKDSLLNLLNNIDSMKADFNQSINDQTGRSLQKADGHMALQQPSQFRWEVSEPVAQIVVTNGKHLWIYDPDLQQVTIRFLNKAMGETPALLLTNPRETLTRDFDVRNMRSQDVHSQWFLLLPKSTNSMIEAIRLGFFNSVLREMEIDDHLSHTTVITFSHIKINSDLSPSLFTFNLPPKVDVLDETKG